MKARNINLILFFATLAILIAIPFVSGKLFKINQNAPWQFSPFNSGDSLSVAYTERYRVMDAPALIRRMEDTTRTIVSVMIDGWGVPYDEEILAADFALFDAKTTQFTLHKRLAGHTSHAENVEMRTGFKDGLSVVSGDSSECSQFELLPRFGAKQTFCCLNCTDGDVAVSLDSLLADTTWKRMEWTVHETNLGDRDKLHSLLRQLSDVSAKHPEVQFIIQGTHRPILGTPETRRKYNARWVPAVFINCKLKPEKK